MSFHNTNGETLIKASTFHESDVCVGLVTLHMDFTNDYNYLLKIAQQIMIYVLCFLPLMLL